MKLKRADLKSLKKTDGEQQYDRNTQRGPPLKIFIVKLSDGSWQQKLNRKITGPPGAGGPKAGGLRAGDRYQVQPYVIRTKPRGMPITTPPLLSLIRC